MSNEKLVET